MPQDAQVPFSYNVVRGHLQFECAVTYNLDVGWKWSEK